MSVSPVNSNPPLRLVSPVQPVRPVRPAQPIQAAQTAQSAQPVQGDSYDFEAVYRASLPRPALTDAHARLERIRNLVAAKTDVPIHFGPPAAPRTANPYVNSYLQFPKPAPADINTAATEQAGR